MFIFLFSLKPDKVCICNLSGKPEIWISHELMAKDNDAVLDCLRKKLNDNTITKLITVREQYIIIRHPKRMKYIELGQIPNKFPDDRILYDDLYFVLDLMNEYINESDISEAELLYRQSSDRIKLDINVIYIYLSIDGDRCNRFSTLSNKITKKMIIELFGMCCDGCNIQREELYSYLSESMRRDMDIIKCVLLGACTQDIDYHTDQFFEAAPSYVFDYDFIIQNFDNACVITIYLWMDYGDDDRFNKMDIHERIVLLKMAIKYTMELYKSTDQEYILYMLKKVTKKYIDHISESDEFDNEALALEELLDILSSDTFS
jgi:hypothetical protein